MSRSRLQPLLGASCAVFLIFASPGFVEGIENSEPPVSATTGSPGTALTTVASTGEVVMPLFLDLIPAKDFHKDWTSFETEVFTHDNLYKRINGEAELYLPYGFESLLATNFTGPASKSFDLEIFRMGSPLDAFGIYSNYRDASQERLPIGIDGVITESQAMFCQDRFFVRISAAFNKQPDRATLLAFAKAVSRNITQGAPSPALLPELSWFDVPEVASRTEKLTATSLLGYAFFTKGLAAEATFEGKPLKYFVVLAGSEASAARALESYSEHLRKENGQPRLEQPSNAALSPDAPAPTPTLIGRDPLYKGVVVRRSGDRLLGIAKFEDPQKGLPLIDRWVAHIQSAPTSPHPPASPATQDAGSTSTAPEGGTTGTLGPMPGVASMPRHIIRTIVSVHCKRGPEACDKCKAIAGPKICLLDVSPPDQGMVQRRVIQVTIGGEKIWREFDVVRSFADEAEARAYASANGITDLDFSPP